MTLKRQ